MSEVSSDGGNIAGTFNDGLTAAKRRVHVTLAPSALVVCDQAGEPVARWAYAQLRLTDDDRRDGPPRLCLAEDTGARLVLDDRAALVVIARRAPHLLRRNAISRAALISLGGLAGTAVLAACLWFGIPWLAQVAATSIPVSWERSLGDRIFDSTVVSFFMTGDDDPVECVDAAGIAAIERLVARLTPQASPYEFRVTVLDVSVTNAMAFPGGRIVILRGLLDFVDDPREVAGVLAHEMAHVIHRDTTVAILRQMGTDGLLTLVSGLGTSTAIGETLLDLSFSREAEAAADTGALDILRAANIEAAGLGEFFRRLNDKHGDVPGKLTFLSTHPSNDSRIRYFEQSRAVGGGPAMSAEEWQALRAICASRAAKPPPYTSSG